MKKIVDIVILSDAKSETHKAITETALESLFASEPENIFNVIVIEANKKVKYEGTQTVHLDEPFNYNKFMNIGAKMGKCPYIAFCNNDLVFEKSWASYLIIYMNRFKLDCGSPYSATAEKHKTVSATGQVFVGIENGLHLAGWCFMLKRTAWEKIGGLDEDFGFWCADNATLEQLTAFNMRAGLVTQAKVQHIGGGGNTLQTLNEIDKNSMTWGYVKKFNRKYGRNLFNIGT